VTVEILYFDGCPHYREAQELVERVRDELDLPLEVRLVEVADVEAAERVGFLGSPTIRVDGHDVEPGADERDGFAFGCRVYANGAGLPDERLVRDALAARPG
jgi:hypothetical protein